MKFRLIVRSKSGGEWVEDYDKAGLNTQEQIDAWGKATVERFNATLYEGEEPREFVRAELHGEGAEHDWRKTNLVTVMRGSMSYDEYRCESCQITGKRFGLSGSVRRDKEFKAAGFGSCIQAKVLLERRRNRARSEDQPDD